MARASHPASGTELKSTALPTCKLSSESQTQVLISYSVGYRGQADMVVRFLTCNPESALLQHDLRVVSVRRNRGAPASTHLCERQVLPVHGSARCLWLPTHHFDTILTPPWAPISFLLRDLHVDRSIRRD